MTFTQTISTEYHPCESLPVVFGAPCSATSPLSGSLQAVCADLPAANAASHRSTSATTNLAGTNQTAPPASPSANAPSNPAPDHLRWSRWFESGPNGDWRSLDGKWYWRHIPCSGGCVSLPIGWHPTRYLGECGNWSGEKRASALANPPSVPPPSPVAEALTWDEVKSRRGVYLTDRFMFPESRYASDGNGSVLYYHIGLGIGPRGCDDGCDCIALPNETIPPHVAAKFPQPAPAVEQAGTVDAKWVREHAGEYEFAGELGDAPGTIIAAKGKYVSDGNGHVKFFGTMAGLELNGATLKTHPDIAKEPSPLARFRPLPSPSANPPETPGSSGEPKFGGGWEPPAIVPTSECTTHWWKKAEESGWNRAADAWRTYHTAQLATLRASLSLSQGREQGLRETSEMLTTQLSALRAERDALKKAKDENDERFMIERDTARAERDAMRPVVEAAERWLDHFAPMKVTVPASANLELEVLRYRSLHLPAKSEKGGAA